MANKIDKERQQEALEKARRRHNKNLATIKASNQMLDEALEKAKEVLKDSPDELDVVERQIENAKKENLDKVVKELGSNEEEMKRAEYNKPSQHEIEKYDRWLKKNKLTEEELRRQARPHEVKEEKAPLKKLFSFQKNKKNEEEKDETIYKPIDPKKRTVKGDGYVETDIKKENDTEPYEYMKKLIKEKDIIESANVEDNINEKMDGLKSINSKQMEKEILDFDNKEKSYQEFDPSTVPEGCEYDMVRLPSKGQCYPHKHSRIPVRSLNASDEDIITTPNLYDDGKVIDVLLKRCILDKNINPDELCKGDRDAILVWLRADAYGPKFPIIAKNPETNKTYDTNIDLSEMVKEYLPFNLVGDENGWFDYTDGKGNLIKYRLLTKHDYDKLQHDISSMFIRLEKININECIIKIENNINDINGSEVDETLQDAVNYIKEWNNNIETDIKTNEVKSNTITSQMILYTMSVNGNTDRKYISDFIQNMKAGEARKYRTYVNEHIPGINFEIKVDIPESDGGGSFTTFLRIDDTIFINV